MKRALVLSNDAARHPFRRSLPRPVLTALKAEQDDDKDLKLFVLSFTAFFVTIFSFIG